MDKLKAFGHLPLRSHIIIGTFLRLALICYANYHDKNFDVNYTDIDYKVFTDAARHVYNGNSPYKRHTFRYSPLIAYLVLPNVFLFKEFGKLLFTIFDVLIALAIKKLVEYQLGCENKTTRLICNYCALFWLYNPVSIAISTRGNADSIPCFFIILSILFLQTDVVTSFRKYVLSGIFLGISVHLRLYPIVFSFPMYLSIGTYQLRRVTVKDIVLYLLPNKNQFLLALSCILTLISLTLGMYYLYGYEFLFETYIYHIFRKDTKHNFSVLFYYSYLTMNNLEMDMLKFIVTFFEAVLLFVLSLTFGYDPKTLPFGLFCQSVILVAYNSVITSQYFVWFLSLLPLVVHNIKIHIVSAILIIMIWLGSQAAWLYQAYYLEMKCDDVFFLLWTMSLLFFFVNIKTLSALIKCFTPGFGFGYNYEVNCKES